MTGSNNVVLHNTKHSCLGQTGYRVPIPGLPRSSELLILGNDCRRMPDGRARRKGCLADWGPDTLAASCNVCGCACWVGAARVTALRPPAMDTSPDVPEQTPLVSCVELWWLRLAYDGTDYAGWQKQSEVAWRGT